MRVSMKRNSRRPMQPQHAGDGIPGSVRGPFRTPAPPRISRQLRKKRRSQSAGLAVYLAKAHQPEVSSVASGVDPASGQCLAHQRTRKILKSANGANAKLTHQRETDSPSPVR